jgi:hypothetical protein
LKEKEKDLKKRVEKAEWVRKREEEKNAKLAKETKKKAGIEVGDAANSKGKEKGFVRIVYLCFSFRGGR